MHKYKFLIYLILLLPLSCLSQNNNHPRSNDSISRANLLNNKALKISLLNCNKDSIEESINLMEQAIKLDDTVPIFYSNESQMFCDLRKYKEAIKALNRYLFNFPVNTALETLKGFIFERTGNMDSATTSYSKVIKQYDLKIQNDPNNIYLQLNRAFLLFFTKGDVAAKMEYSRIAKKSPNNENVKTMREDFRSFKRKSYIDQIFSSCLFPTINNSSNTTIIR